MNKSGKWGGFGGQGVLHWNFFIHWNHYQKTIGCHIALYFMSCLLEVDIVMCSMVTRVLLFTRWTLMAALLTKLKGLFFFFDITSAFWVYILELGSYLSVNTLFWYNTVVMGVVSVSSVIQKMLPYPKYTELIHLAVELANELVIGKWVPIIFHECQHLK